MMQVLGPIMVVQDPQWKGWEEGRIRPAVTQHLLNPQDPTYFRCKRGMM